MDRKWRSAVTFDALGWRMAERCQQAALLPGDRVDIAFSIENNDHPEYGGLELSLRDFAPGEKTTVDASAGDTTKQAENYLV
jgi:hypothetical protein